MALSPGTRLGPYEIVSLLGVGGMGEVYRATDTRLGRAVALKVLPEDFLEGEEAKARFEREARLLASLNHPGIATLYSFEEIPGSSPSSSRHLLAMELVEGEDLARRLASGPLPLEESLSFARQISEALEAAHEKGIVHRDLKPANVKVSANGRVKLLDFGLAKRSEAAPVGAEDETSSGPLTQRGTIVGTLPYMSPEQVEGRPVGSPSDVFSFGVVLYEMATGRRPFTGNSPAAVISSILRDAPPPPSRLLKGVARELDGLVARCLEKDPARRPSAADVQGDLVRALAGPARAPGRSRLLAPLGIAAAAGALLLSALVLRRGPAPTDLPKAPAAPSAGEQGSAFDLYEKARAAYLANTKADNSRAITLYDGALRVDPKYAPAWAGLAFACARYSFQYFDGDPAWAGRAEEAAARALEYGPYLAEAHQARAQVLSSQHQNFDFRRALPEVRRALELSPNLEIAHYWMGVGYGLHLGLHEEAMRALERAGEISPKWASPVASMGWVRLQEGRYDDALLLAGRAVQMAPGFSVAWVTLADAHLRKGNDAEAAGEIARALEKEPRNTWAISLQAVLAERRGDRAGADALLERASGLYDDHHVQYNAALVAAARGEAAAAVARLRKAVAGNFNPYPWFAADPLLAPVRGDAAFRAFLEDSRRTFEADRVAFAAR